MGKKCPYLAKNASFLPNLAVICPFRPMPVGTWDTLGIKIPKPPYKSSLKMVGFVHFSNFLLPSEKYYNLQSCWITLYTKEKPKISPRQAQNMPIRVTQCPKWHRKSAKSLLFKLKKKKLIIWVRWGLINLIVGHLLARTLITADITLECLFHYSAYSAYSA